MVPWTDDLVVFEMPPNADKTYGWYVMQLYSIYQKVSDAKLRLSVKYVDNFILSETTAEEV